MTHLGNRSTPQRDRYARRNAISGPSLRGQLDGNSAPFNSSQENGPDRWVAEALLATRNHELSQKGSAQSSDDSNQSLDDSTASLRPRPLVIQKVNERSPLSENGEHWIHASASLQTDEEELQDDQAAMPARENTMEDEELEGTDHDEDNAEAQRAENNAEAQRDEAEDRDEADKEDDREESEDDGDAASEEEVLSFFWLTRALVRVRSARAVCNFLPFLSPADRVVGPILDLDVILLEPALEEDSDRGPKKSVVFCESAGTC